MTCSRLGEALAPAAAPSATSDVLVAAILAEASVAAGAATARTNLVDTELSEVTVGMEQELTRLHGDARVLHRRVCDVIGGRA